jgi:hypothetical protein
MIVNGIGCGKQMGDYHIIYTKKVIMVNQNSNTAPSPRQAFNGQGVLRIPGRKNRIATWNVRSLLKSGKLVNVINEMNRLYIDIL